MTDRTRTPVTIGVTGGIGAGKSELVAALGRLGAVTYSADAAVHRLYRSAEVIELVRERWGDSIMNGDVVNRAAIADIVFNNPAELEWLESVLHPRVGADWNRFVILATERKNPPGAIVAEVPLLFEAGVESRYDHVSLVTAPLTTRLERVGDRASGGASHAEARALRQMPEFAKASKSDSVFVNDGNIEAVDEFAKALLEKLGVSVSDSKR